MNYLREPLLHFIILGALIFLVFSFVNKGESESSDKIVVTAGKIQHLANTFALTWNRPPTEEELDGLVHDYIREEVLYREAIAIGLDENDTIIRRRLRQKMEFISEDIVSQIQLSEEQLQEYLEKHPEKFKTEPAYTFSQIYLNPESRGSEIAGDIQELLLNLNNSGTDRDVATLGDRIMLENHYLDASKSEVDVVFGDNFTAQLAVTETGTWQGPLESGYGVHLVLIDKRTEGRLPQLDEIRDTIKRELENERRVEANEKFYQSLLNRYEVVVEQPLKLSRETVGEEGKVQ